MLCKVCIKHNRCETFKMWNKFIEDHNIDTTELKWRLMGSNCNAFTTRTGYDGDRETDGVC